MGVEEGFIQYTLIIMKYFTIKEMCVSGSYPKLTEIPKEGSTVYNNLVYLIEHLLDPLREKLGKPVIVTSGWRPPKLNKAVGGSSTSNHLYGCAADVHIKGSNVEIIEALLSLNIPYDECIAEHAVFNKNGELTSCEWVHLAVKPSNNRNKFIYTSDMKTYHQLKRKTKITK